MFTRPHNMIANCCVWGHIAFIIAVQLYIRFVVVHIRYIFTNELMKYKWSTILFQLVVLFNVRLAGRLSLSSCFALHMICRAVVSTKDKDKLLMFLLLLPNRRHVNAKLTKSREDRYEAKRIAISLLKESIPIIPALDIELSLVLLLFISGSSLLLLSMVYVCCLRSSNSLCIVGGSVKNKVHVMCLCSCSLLSYAV